MTPRLIATLILALTFVPFATLIPGGETDPGYWARMTDWGLGTVLCMGVGGIAFLVARSRSAAAADRTRETTAVPRAGAARESSFGQATVPGIVDPDRRFVIATTLLALCLYLAVSQFAFSARPLLIDEVVQVLQARWYASGRLWIPTPSQPELTAIMHVVDLGPRTFSQFPAGGPAMLALGSLVGAEWIVGPVAGAGAVALFASLVRSIEPRATRRWRRGATILFALTPFGVFMFGSHMNHTTTLLWLLVACVALARAVADDSSPWWGFLVGVALGVAATIRPMDGAAFALPAAGWLLWRARRGGRPLAALLLSGVGIAIPIAGLLLVNAQTTGEALLFGYEQLWGASHGLGFHAAPWGPVHTPARGIELLSLYFVRLSTYLFELPFPSILLVAAGLWSASRLASLERYLVVSGGLLLTGYWAYWHRGDLLGPRFLFPLLPLLVLWSARFPRALSERLGATSPAWTGAKVALAFSVVLAVVDLSVLRLPSYRNGLTSMRVDVARESAAAGVRDAVVLVKESWGARIVVRMWALGVPRSEAEYLYRKVDACRLHLALTQVEGTGLRGAGATARLIPLLADSGRVTRSSFAADESAGWDPSFAYVPACETQLAMDRRGYSHLAPFRLATDSNLYLRWFPGREAEVAAAYPGRPVYRLARAGYAVDAPLVWERLQFGARP